MKRLGLIGLLLAAPGVSHAQDSLSIGNFSPPASPPIVQAIESRWSKQWGDRMHELVFIGQDMDKAGIIAELESCLLTDSEVRDFEVRLRFSDPFPRDI